MIDTSPKAWSFEKIDPLLPSFGGIQLKTTGCAHSTVAGPTGREAQGEEPILRKIRAAWCTRDASEPSAAAHAPAPRCAMYVGRRPRTAAAEML